MLWSPKGVEDAYLPMQNCNFVSMHIYRNLQVSLLMEKRKDKDNQNTLANPSHLKSKFIKSAFCQYIYYLPFQLKLMLKQVFIFKTHQPTKRHPLVAPRIAENQPKFKIY